jgi:magnesium chelatase subunit I
VALAALEGRAVAAPRDVARVATLALQHRLRKNPLDTISDDDRVRRAVEDVIPA